MASPEIVRAIEALRQAGARDRKLTQPIEEQRAEITAKLAGQPPNPAFRLEEISIDGIRAMWVTPPNAGDDFVILFFHGGAYAKGPLEASYGATFGHCRALGARALSVQYRLAPEHPYPAALEDARTAYHHLLAEGYAPERIVVSGSSAGGGLAASLVLSCREHGDPQPLAAVLIAPWGDLTNSGSAVATRADRDPVLSKAYLDRFAGLYVGDADPTLPTVSPALADHSGVTTAILAQVGSEEVLYDDSLRIVQRAKAAGCMAELEEFEMGFHGWQNLGEGTPEAAAAYRSAADFVKRAARRAAGATERPAKTA